MKTLAVVAALILAVSMPASAENKTSSLRITVVIPPQLCDTDRACEQTTSSLPAAATRVVIDGQRVQYVGSEPTITETEELKTILL